MVVWNDIAEALSSRDRPIPSQIYDDEQKTILAPRPPPWLPAAQRLQSTQRETKDSICFGKHISFKIEDISNTDILSGKRENICSFENI